MCRCVRPIHWTRSPASEAGRNSSHLKRRSSNSCQAALMSCLPPLRFHNNLRLLEKCHRGRLPRPSFLQLNRSKRTTQETLEPRLFIEMKAGHVGLTMSPSQRQPLGVHVKGIKLATSSTHFSMKLFIFLPGLIQVGAKERGKMRRPQGSIESLNLFIFSLRNDGNPLSKPPQQPASLHPHGNSGHWTNTLHAISFLPSPLLQRHLSFSVRCARDKHPTTSAQKDLKHPLSSAPFHFPRLRRAKARKSRRQLNGAFPR